MAYPWNDYERVIGEAKAIIQNRDGKGRNEHTPFYDTRCFGSQDCLGEVWQRVTRMIGAAKAGDDMVLREDAIDLVNEAIHVVMFLDKEKGHGKVAHSSAVAGPERVRL